MQEKKYDFIYNWKFSILKGEIITTLIDRIPDAGIKTNVNGR